MTLDVQQAQSLEEMWQAAMSACEDGPVYNLALAFEVPLNAIDDAFVEAYEGDAQQWLADPHPGELYFSHGEYFLGDRGTDYVINELRRSGTRRALLSLLPMKDLLVSLDDPVPSFIVLQFGISDDLLLMTAYFRALEVESFLRINLAEVALHARSVRAEFGSLRRLRVTLIAFRAYREPGFRLARAQIDIQQRGSVAITAAAREIAQLRTWLEEKLRFETKSSTEGLTELLTGAESAGEPYPPRFLVAVRGAIHELDEISGLRRAHSESDVIQAAHRRYEQHLRDALEELRNL